MVESYVLPEEFLTERLLLRRPAMEDAVGVDAYASDAEVARYVDWPLHKSIEDAYEFLKLVDREWETQTGFNMAINWQARPNELIGMIHTHLRDNGVHYGYALRRDAWGQGVASECLSALVEHALAHPDVYRVSAYCDAENHASARVMEKAGMEREGLMRRYAVHPRVSPEPRDCYLYARVK